MVIDIAGITRDMILTEIENILRKQHLLDTYDVLKSDPECREKEVYGAIDLALDEYDFTANSVVFTLEGILYCLYLDASLPKLLENCTKFHEILCECLEGKSVFDGQGTIHITKHEAKSCSINTLNEQGKLPGGDCSINDITSNKLYNLDEYHTEVFRGCCNDYRDVTFPVNGLYFAIQFNSDKVELPADQAADNAQE